MKTKSCSGCAGLMKSIGNSTPHVYCEGNYHVEEIETVVYNKKLDFDVNIRPINNCKRRTLLSYALMRIEDNKGHLPL